MCLAAKATARPGGVPLQRQDGTGTPPAPASRSRLTCLDPERLNTSSACADLQRSVPRCFAISAFSAAARRTMASGTSAALTRAHSGSKLPASTLSRRALQEATRVQISTEWADHNQRLPTAVPSAGRLRGAPLARPLDPPRIGDILEERHGQSVSWKVQLPLLDVRVCHGNPYAVLPIIVTMYRFNDATRDRVNLDPASTRRAVSLR